MAQRFGTGAMDALRRNGCGWPVDESSGLNRAVPGWCIGVQYSPQKKEGKKTRADGRLVWALRRRLSSFFLLSFRKILPLSPLKERENFGSRRGAEIAEIWTGAGAPYYVSH